MPSDDYSAIRGGLKLKGSKPAGVTKKKKKSKTPKDTNTTSNDDASQDIAEGEKSKLSALQKALEDEDVDMRGKDGKGEELDEVKLRELDPRDDDGKTASERQYEDMRRKRVCFFVFSTYCSVSNYGLIACFYHGYGDEEEEGLLLLIFLKLFLERLTVHTVTRPTRPRRRKNTQAARGRTEQISQHAERAS
jgi:protein FAM32A